MEKLRQDLKEAHFERVYLLYGEERYLVQLYKNQLKKAVIGDDTMNFNEFTGKNPSLHEVEDAVMTMPFFAEKRLVLLEETGLLKGSDDGWVSLIESIPESCCVLFVEQNADKRSRIYKKINEIGYCCEMRRQTPQQLTQWVLRGFGTYGLKITQGALESFLNKTGEDMENIRNEMDKVAAYCAGQEGISLQDVETVCTERLANRIFDMTQAVSEGRTRHALELYYDLLALKEPGMRILFLIAKQMNQLMCVKEMEAGRQTRDQIADALKVKPYIAGKLLAQARQFTSQQLRRFVEQCVELEEAVKNGNMSERIAVEMVLLSIAERVEA